MPITDAQAGLLIERTEYARTLMQNGSKWTQRRTVEAAMPKSNGGKNGNGSSRVRWIALVCTLSGIIFGAGAAYATLYYKVDNLCSIVADHETRIRENHDQIIYAKNMLDRLPIIEQKLDEALKK